MTDLTPPLTAEPDSDERIYASILRENQTWADRCADLAAENFALRSALLDVQQAIRDALGVPTAEPR